MKRKLTLKSIAIPLMLLLAWSTRGEQFRVGTYNLESYLDKATSTRAAKSADSKAKIRTNIVAIRPDVLALQEIGSVSALLELRDSLKTEGLDLPYWHFVASADTNIHVAVLSKFPFTEVRSHTNENFLLDGRRFHVSRGFAELDIAVSPSYAFTLIAAHLKSKRAVPEANEAELRLEEAKLLREKIDLRLSAAPEANLVVLGDFNDTKDSATIKTVIGRGRTKLVDTRPAEQNGDSRHDGERQGDRRNVTWTHYYSTEDTYSRIDFLLLSRRMARSWMSGESYVLATADWGLASDHRPVVATFEASEQ